MNTATDSILKILRLSQVQERIGLSRSTIYDRMNPNSPRFDSTFPRPVKLGASAIGWFESGITEWLMGRR
jgi:prophage regulatory protein